MGYGGLGAISVLWSLQTLMLVLKGMESWKVERLHVVKAEQLRVLFCQALEGGLLGVNDRSSAPPT